MSSAATARPTRHSDGGERPTARWASKAESQIITGAGVSEVTAVTHDGRLANAARCDGHVDPRAS